MTRFPTLKCFSSLLAILLQTGAASTSESYANTEAIQPDPHIQARLAEIAQSNSTKDPLRFYGGLVALRAIADNDPASLVRQLVWYDVHTATNGEMTTLLVLKELPQLQSDLVTTLAPLMGKTEDAKTDREIEQLFYFLERPTGAGDLNFREYEVYIRGRIDRDLPFDKPFVGYLFRRAPGQTLEAFAISSFGGNRRKPFLWARHTVDDLLWKRRNSFVPDRQPDAAVTKQLEVMATSEPWWARLYAAEIIRQYPELGTKEIIEKLKTDNNDLVRNALGYRGEHN